MRDLPSRRRISNNVKEPAQRLYRTNSEQTGAACQEAIGPATSQTTITVEVRRALKLAAGDRIVFESGNGKATLRNTVSTDCSLLSTDGHFAYRQLDDEFPHGAVDHRRKQYIVGALHTNTIEGFWSLIKRGVMGSYQSEPQISSPVRRGVSVPI